MTIIHKHTSNHFCNELLTCHYHIANLLAFLYPEEQVKLQQKLEELTPIPDDEVEKAASILEDLPKYWNDTKSGLSKIT